MTDTVPEAVDGIRPKLALIERRKFPFIVLR